MADHRRFTKKIYCQTCGRPLARLKGEMWKDASPHKFEFVVTCDRPCEKSVTVTLGHRDMAKHDNQHDIDQMVARQMQNTAQSAVK